MKRRRVGTPLTLSLVCLSLLACPGWGCSSKAEESDTPQAKPAQPAEPWTHLIPIPTSVTTSEGGATIDASTVVVVDASDADTKRVGEMLAAWLGRAIGASIPLVSSASGSAIRLRLDPAAADLGDEGYELTSNEGGVMLVARAASGLFHGIQTLRQMLPLEAEAEAKGPRSFRVGAGAVKDSPRFAWRGLSIDVARHFFTPEEVCRYIDVMAHYKMNRLHLHLTDDQGWRIAIDAYPELTAIGGGTQVGGGKGGFYSKTDYQQIVAYAADRFITVVPEIDMPGHTRAALSSLPELNCDGVAPEPYTGTSVGISTLCIGRPFTEAFVKTVIDEVAAMTPGPYLHIGGDEAKKTSEWDPLESTCRHASLSIL